MVLSTVFRSNSSYKLTSANVDVENNHSRSNCLVQSVPISMSSTSAENGNRITTKTKNTLFTLLSSPFVVEGLAMNKPPEDKCVHMHNTQKTKTVCTRYNSQGPWTSQPMPKISEETKQSHQEPLPKKSNFLKRQLLKLKRKYLGPSEPLQLDGPYINPLASCSCGECVQEYYVNKYVGYGINIYGNKACAAIPAYCNDFAVIFYC